MTQLAKSVAGVLRDLTPQLRATPRPLASLLGFDAGTPRRVQIAEPADRLFSRCGGIQALALELRRAHVDVKPDLLVHVLADLAPAATKVAKGVAAPGGGRHAAAGRSTLPTAST